MNMLPHQMACFIPKDEEVTDTGIVLPHAAADKEKASLTTGEIVLVGEGVPWEVGTRVIFPEGTYWVNKQRKNPEEFEYEGRILTRVLEREVIAIIT